MWQRPVQGNPDGAFVLSKSVPTVVPAFLVCGAGAVHTEEERGISGVSLKGTVGVTKLLSKIPVTNYRDELLGSRSFCRL